ncbi:sulfatase family protein [Sinomicrobium sp. M5D2P9]
MKRINSLLIISFLLFSIMVEAQDKGQRPNVVIFIADDLGRNDIGPYGNRTVKTTNLDELANESVVFNQAFAASPTCTPSRASIHTGLMPFRNGAHANHTGLKDGVKTLPAYLQAEGYKVGFAGKLHIGPVEAYPFDLIKGTNVREPGHENDGVLWTDLELGPVDKWLNKASGDQTPFVLVVNDHSPHVIWPEEPAYSTGEVDIPSMHIDTKDTRKSRARYYTDITKMDKNVGKMRELVRKNGLEENTIFIFTADQGPQWAFGKWNLYDYGIQVPLMVYWPGRADENRENDDLVSLTDLLPTLIEIAGGKAPEFIDGKSFLGLLNGEKTTHRKSVYGSHTGDGNMNRSPMRMIRTKRYKYILNLAPEEEYHTHIDKAKDHDGGREYWNSWKVRSFSEDADASAVLWRYHKRPKEELYDIVKDPGERNNLAAHPDYKEITGDFRKQMEEWRKGQNDSETGPYKPEKTKNNGKNKKPVAPYIF